MAKKQTNEAFYNAPLKYRNSAGRLHRVLFAVRDLGVRWNGSIAELWAVILGVQGDNARTAVFEHVGRLFEVTARLEQEIHERVQDEDKRALYLELIPRIRQVLGLAAANEKSALLMPQLDPVFLQFLLLVAVDLPKEGEISAEDLSKLTQMFADLFTHIDKAELHADLKKWLLSLLADGQRSIAEFQIRGAEAFTAALKEMFVTPSRFQYQS